MKKLLILMMVLTVHSVKAQISIIQDKPEEVKEVVCLYDSLLNLKEQRESDDISGFRHLKGQTMMYCGDPWQYHYNSPKIPVGDYYYVKDVQIYKGSSLKKYCVFVVENTKTHEESTFDCYASNHNEQWVVVGYYEKQKSKYVGKEFVYRGKYDYLHKFDNLISFDTDTVTKGIKEGSIWKCVDVSVKLRTHKDWRYEVNDHRSPVVLVVENPEYGKHYCFLEDTFGSHYSITNQVYNGYGNGLPLICGKFQDKIAYDKIEFANAQAKQKRLAELTKKYGSSNAKDLIQGYIRIGMTKEMCRESWGEPDDINKTTTSYGTSEQWVYGYCEFCNLL